MKKSSNRRRRKRSDDEYQWATDDEDAINVNTDDEADSASGDLDTMMAGLSGVSLSAVLGDLQRGDKYYTRDMQPLSKQLYEKRAALARPWEDHLEDLRLQRQRRGTVVNIGESRDNALVEQVREQMMTDPETSRYITASISEAEEALAEEMVEREREDIEQQMMKLDENDASMRKRFRRLTAFKRDAQQEVQKWTNELQVAEEAMSMFSKVSPTTAETAERALHRFKDERRLPQFKPYYDLKRAVDKAKRELKSSKLALERYREERSELRKQHDKASSEYRRLQRRAREINSRDEMQFEEDKSDDSEVKRHVREEIVKDVHAQAEALEESMAKSFVAHIEGEKKIEKLESKPAAKRAKKAFIDDQALKGEEEDSASTEKVSDEASVDEEEDDE
jgi:hypothetical protein